MPSGELHREKVAIARRIRALRRHTKVGCIIRAYSDGKDVAVNGYQGGMFCVWCPDQDMIPNCKARCLNGRYTCRHVGVCPCSIPYSKRRLAAFMRWLLRHVQEQMFDRHYLERCAAALRYEDVEESANIY